MHLGPQHTAEFVRQALDQGTFVVCRQTLTYGDNPDFGPAICPGLFDAFAGRSPALGLRRNAIYKVIFDARRKIRRGLVANGVPESRAGSDE